MFSAIRNRLNSEEEGFTLIELLVVVIIIGILAAIAIPTFLNQRERGWQAELTSSVRNAALEVEALATASGGQYPTTANAPNLTAFTAGGETPLTYTGTATAFTICGSHTLINGAENVTYTSAGGGIQPFVSGTGC